MATAEHTKEMVAALPKICKALVLSRPQRFPPEDWAEVVQIFDAFVRIVDEKMKAYHVRRVSYMMDPARLLDILLVADRKKADTSLLESLTLTNDLISFVDSVVLDELRIRMQTRSKPPAMDESLTNLEGALPFIMQIRAISAEWSSERMSFETKSRQQILAISTESDVVPRALERVLFGEELPMLSTLEERLSVFYVAEQLNAVIDHINIRKESVILSPAVSLPRLTRPLAFSIITNRVNNANHPGWNYACRFLCFILDCMDALPEAPSRTDVISLMTAFDYAASRNDILYVEEGRNLSGEALAAVRREYLMFFSTYAPVLNLADVSENVSISSESPRTSRPIQLNEIRANWLQLSGWIGACVGTPNAVRIILQMAGVFSDVGNQLLDSGDDIRKVLLHPVTEEPRTLENILAIYASKIPRSLRDTLVENLPIADLYQMPWSYDLVLRVLDLASAYNKPLVSFIADGAATTIAPVKPGMPASLVIYVQLMELYEPLFIAMLKRIPARQGDNEMVWHVLNVRTLKLYRLIKASLCVKGLVVDDTEIKHARFPGRIDNLVAFHYKQVAGSRREISAAEMRNPEMFLGAASDMDAYLRFCKPLKESKYFQDFPGLLRVRGDIPPVPTHLTTMSTSDLASMLVDMSACFGHALYDYDEDEQALIREKMFEWKMTAMLVTFVFAALGKRYVYKNVDDFARAYTFLVLSTIYDKTDLANSKADPFKIFFGGQVPDLNIYGRVFKGDSHGAKEHARLLIQKNESTGSPFADMYPISCTTPIN
jgi:hypothetical protein